MYLYEVDLFNETIDLNRDILNGLKIHSDRIHDVVASLEFGYRLNNDTLCNIIVNFRSAHISVKPHVYFDTYVKIEDMPSDMVGLVFLRSSVGITKGFVLDNAVAVIDSDYKDTIKISMHGVDTRSYNELKAGDRIAQIVFMKYHTVDDEIEPNQDRDGGIGSTGQ